MTHREEDRRDLRGKVAAKGATAAIFWRLAGGEEDELLAPRVLLFDAIFGCGERGLRTFVAGPRKENLRNGHDGRRIDAEITSNSTPMGRAQDIRMPIQ